MISRALASVFCARIIVPGPAAPNPISTPSPLVGPAAPSLARGRVARDALNILGLNPIALPPPPPVPTAELTLMEEEEEGRGGAIARPAFRRMGRF